MDSLGSVQLAISAAISNAFKTPEARAAPCAQWLVRRIWAAVRRVAARAERRVARARTWTQVIKMFALKQPAQLRQRLEQLQARSLRSADCADACLACSSRAAARAAGAARQKAGQDQQGGGHAAGRGGAGGAAEARRHGAPSARQRAQFLVPLLIVCLCLSRAQLSPEEEEFLAGHMTDGLAAFQAVTNTDGTVKAR